MVKIRDAFLNTDNFEFQINHQGIVQLSFGPTHVCMSLDSAFDLQYRLAAFLAEIEVEEYQTAENQDNPNLSESEDNLKFLASHNRIKRVDA